MGLLYMDGFETYGSANDTLATFQPYLQKRWSAIDLSSSAILSSNAYEGEGLCLDGVGTSSSYSIRYSTPGVSSEMLIGFAIYTGSGSASYYWYAAGSNGQQVGLYYLESVDGLRIFCGTSVDTASGLLLPNTWYYIEFAYKIHPSAGYWRLYINGSLIDSRTGIDTLASSYLTEIFYHSFVLRNSGTRFDDIYIYDNTGDVQAPFGPIKIRALVPDGDDTSDWTSSGANHYDQVNDIPVVTANYIESETPSDVDLFSFANSSDPSNWPIYGVQLNVHAAVTDVGVFTLEGIADSNGSQDTANVTIIDNLGRDYNFIFETDPETSNAWTMDKLNDAVFGVGVE